MAEPYKIKMPQLSDTMTEGIVVSWEKEIGDKIKRGDIVATIETDKAIMDVEVFREGFLSGPQAPADAVLPVGEALAFLVATADEVVHGQSKADSSASSVQEQASEASTSPAKTAYSQPASFSTQTTQIAPRPDNKNATPYARKLAGAWQVDLNQVQGTGPEGEIQAGDVERARSQQSAGPKLKEKLPQELAESMPVVGNVRSMNAMEKAIVLSMTSTLSMPTFRTMMRAKPSALIKAAKKKGISVTVAIAKACALALQEHPILNAAYVPGFQIAERKQVDIGMAVAVEGGLVVPVLRNCESRELEELVVDWKSLVKKARSRRLSPDEYANPTFMVSNMGMLGVDYFDAIPTPGTAAILAISATDSQGAMPLTVTTDHRVASGAQVAAFLASLKGKIEQPSSWIGPVGSAIPEGEWDYDVVVIGGGPGGEDCARALVEKGVRVAMINDSPFPGGECLWRGCIPSKTWRAAADRLLDRRHDAHLGIEWETPPTLNWKTLEKSRRNLLEARGKMALQTDTGMKIKYFQGFGSFEDTHTVHVDQSKNQNDPHTRAADGDQSQGQRITFGCAVIATGAPPFIPPIPGAKESLAIGGVLTSDTVWHLKAQPKKLGIVGGGAIGAEMAQIFQDFGTEVILLEAQDRILAEVEKEIAKNVTAILEQQPNLTIHTNAKVTSIQGSPGEMKMTYQQADGTSSEFVCDYVLLATGKRPQLDKLNLDKAGVKQEKSVIPVDPFCRSNVEHVFAVGDVNGGLMLAHTAGQQGRVAASAIQGESHFRYQEEKDCGVIFTRPQAAFVGINSDQAKAKGLKPVEMKVPMKIDAKAMITGETDGLIKLIADQDSHKIIGVHLLVDHADTLIGEAVLMVSAGLTLEQVGQAIHPHPTQTELFGEMARRLLSRIHRLAKRKK